MGGVCRKQRGVDLSKPAAWGRAALLLVNADFAVEYPRPLPPHVQMVGPIMISKPKPLPPDLQVGGPPASHHLPNLLLRTLETLPNLIRGPAKQKDNKPDARNHPPVGLLAVVETLFAVSSCFAAGALLITCCLPATLPKPTCSLISMPCLLKEVSLHCASGGARLSQSCP